MKTLIISSSLNPSSHSYVLCKEVEKRLRDKENCEVDFIDLKEMEVKHAFQGSTEDMEQIKTLTEQADNYIFGMAVYCYSVNDSLKSLIDTCFKGGENKLFGILCAAGGEKSFLATQHLIQIMTNEFKMIPLPRIVYATREAFDDKCSITSEDLVARIDKFTEHFYMIGEKLA